MKYVISGQQHDRIKAAIISYLDKNLAPVRGWEKTKTYKKNLKNSDYELFLHFRDGDDEDDHLWYSLHKNPNVTVSKSQSPLLVIPDEYWWALDGYFGEIWKPIFKEWFENNTGLKVKTIDHFGWELAT